MEYVFANIWLMIHLSLLLLPYIIAGLEQSVEICGGVLSRLLLLWGARCHSVQPFRVTMFTGFDSVSRNGDV